MRAQTPSDALRDAAAARTRRDQLTVQAAAAGELVARREREAADLQQRVQGEATDVAKLERLSPAQLWASLRGDLDDRLAVERAEHLAAQQAAAGGQERLAAAQHDLDRLTAAIVDLGDVDAAFAAALAARAEQVRGGGSAASEELIAIDTQLGALAGEGIEISEAQLALAVTQQALGLAQQALDSAGGWSTYDTFFGGGMIADLMKHDRISRSAQAFAAVNRSLEHLATELADLGAAPVEAVQISDSLAVFDVLFDNIFSDWMVRERIANAAHEANLLGERLALLDADLVGRHDGLIERRGWLIERREELLLA
ncbi:hypothetical protein [Microbacterium dauci]|uniref:Uncharacterized protein n=1 Tax=Microbacterium dauci TaxID=3048008 RepID=A0ABT6ZCX6_9MICO|nr:hypothetical protein [Microbacterium sp. LX3-4]MDJ1113988.1 hypothetical protein [Microbacterium sp. LX3-4]